MKTLATASPSLLPPPLASLPPSHNDNAIALEGSFLPEHAGELEPPIPNAAHRWCKISPRRTSCGSHGILLQRRA